MEAPTNPLARSLALAVVAGVCCALAVAAPAHAGETLVVDDDRKDCPDAETTSIQAAVDNASEGDRVEVCPGNYPESITVDTDAVELVGDQATVVDPGRTEVGVGVRAENVTVSGLAVEGHDTGLLVVGNESRIVENEIRASDHGLLLATVYDPTDNVQVSSSLRTTVADNMFRHPGHPDERGQMGIGDFDIGISTTADELLVDLVESLESGEIENATNPEDAVRPLQNRIENNTVEGYHRALALFGAREDRIENNTLRPAGEAAFPVFGDPPTGLFAERSSGNRLVANEIVGPNGTGIHLDHSTGFRLEDNEIHDRPTGLRIDGDKDAVNHYDHQITPTNTVAGDPVVFFNGAENRRVEVGDVAFVGLVNTANVTVADADVHSQILMAAAEDSTVQNATVSGEQPAVIRAGSHGSSIEGLWAGAELREALEVAYSDDVTVQNATLRAVDDYNGIDSLNLWSPTNLTVRDSRLGETNLRGDYDGIAFVNNTVDGVLTPGRDTLSIYRCEYAGNPLCSEPGDPVLLRDNRFVSDPWRVTDQGIPGEPFSPAVWSRNTPIVVEDNTVEGAKTAFDLEGGDEDPEDVYEIEARNNSFQFVRTALDVNLAQGAIVTGNEVRNSDVGIRLRPVLEDPRVADNRFRNVAKVALLVSAENATLVDNEVRDSGGAIGISTSQAEDARIWNTTIQDTDTSLSLGAFVGNLESYEHEIPRNNTVDGKPIIYEVGARDRVVEPPEDPGYVGFVRSNNVTVRNVSLSNAGEGVLLVDSTDVHVKDVRARDNGNGIEVVQSDDVVVEDTTVTDSDGFGVVVHSAEDEARSNDVEIRDNRVDHSSRAGIRVDEARDVTVADNRLSRNFDDEDFRRNEPGIRVRDVEDVRLQANRLYDSRQGIRVGNLPDDPSGPVRVTDNLVEDSLKAGLTVESGADPDHVVVRDNAFVDNEIGVELDAAGILDARNNSWGAADGPSGRAEDPKTGAVADGSGDKVDENVRFDPWREDLPPRIDLPDPNPVREGETLVVDVTAWDPEGDAIDLSVPTTPDGATFTDRGDGTARLTWTPGHGDRGSHDFVVRAEADGLSAQAAATIEVRPGLDAPDVTVLDPVIEADHPVTALLPGQDLVLRADADDADGEVEQVTLGTGEDPSTLRDAERRSGTWVTGPVSFETPGTYEIHAKAVDDDGLTGEAQATIEIRANRPPEIRLRSEPLAVDEVQPEVRIDASPSRDPDGHHVRSLLELPDGREVESSSPMASPEPVNWTPPGAGVYEATVTLEDPRDARTTSAATIEVDDAITVPDLRVVPRGPNQRTHVVGLVLNESGSGVANAGVELTVDVPGSPRPTTVTTVANDQGLFSQALPFDVGVGVTGLNLVGEHGLTVRAEAANQYALAGDDGQGPEVATVQTTYHVEAT